MLNVIWFSEITYQKMSENSENSTEIGAGGRWSGLSRPKFCHKGGFPPPVTEREDNKMNSKELVLNAIQCKETERIPWVPFVGCHAAKLIGVDADEFFRSDKPLSLIHI